MDAIIVRNSGKSGSVLLDGLLISMWSPLEPMKR
jgi:hypothetical protein